MPKQPSFGAEMAIPSPTADSQVKTEYMSIDARARPLKQVRDKFALELLYHGGLATERLGLESEEFYAGIQRLYGQLPIQTLSSSSFKDSIVPVPNLVALAELNDPRLGHLKTDSTSVLIYKDHGQIMKGDMTREVEMAAQSQGYRLFKCSMLWGKTLTHIAQEARRLVTEVTSSNPECEIDIVCWWLGKEVCGDYGCLQPLEAMGTAWRPSTLNSVEHVAARVRNGIEILATLAGMPQVSAVRIHSNPASYTYGLHPEYNVVMTQALEEAASKGLQDGYHARDTYENRAHIVRYLNNMLLLLDRKVVASFAQE